MDFLFILIKRKQAKKLGQIFAEITARIFQPLDRHHSRQQHIQVGYPVITEVALGSSVSRGGTVPWDIE